MNYFDDLEFIYGCFAPQNQARAENKLFDGYYGVQFIAKGELFFHIDGCKPWQDTGPFVFFTAPGKKYTYYSPHGTREQMYLCFRGTRVQRYIDGGLWPAAPDIRIPVTTPGEVAKLFSEIFVALRKNDSMSRAEAVLGLERLLVSIRQQPKIRRKGEVFCSTVREVANRIARQPGYGWDFSELAARHKVSEVHFRRLFRNETGSSPWQYVLNCRIKYACQLLHSSPMLIKEIANECGFRSEFHFSNQFHKNMKMSPEEFRKNF